MWTIWNENRCGVRDLTRESQDRPVVTGTNSEEDRMLDLPLRSEKDVGRQHNIDEQRQISIQVGLKSEEEVDGEGGEEEDKEKLQTSESAESEEGAAKSIDFEGTLRKELEEEGEEEKEMLTTDDDANSEERAWTVDGDVTLREDEEEKELFPIDEDAGSEERSWKEDSVGTPSEKWEDEEEDHEEEEEEKEMLPTDEDSESKEGKENMDVEECEVSEAVMKQKQMALHREQSGKSCTGTK